MKFSNSFLDEIRARLPVSAVVSRRVPLKRAGREWKGLSPFNQEKTPSFTVNDQKGFYHCFSSGKHGDIFGFVMDTEGLSFPEAVERLAGDAGLPMPKPDPQFERVAKERLGLYDALEAACVYFEAADRHARWPRGARLRRAPRAHRPDDERVPHRLRTGLEGRAQSCTDQTRIQRGAAPRCRPPGQARRRPRALTIASATGSPSPSSTRKGRIIAFGARALDAATEPKYLNSPETKLFDKGSTVFNFARARGPAFDKGELIVVEGYMDVIALYQAGFHHTVATLGTAFTERQMDQLWLLAPEPIICFDGDRAGEAAAARAIDRMLPSFARGTFLPLRFPAATARTPTTSCAMKAPARSHAASPRRGRSSIFCGSANVPRPNLDTPERRAALEERLDQLLNTIANTRVRDHYRRDIKSRLFALWRDIGKRSAAPAKAVACPLLRQERRAGRFPQPMASPSPSSSRSPIILRCSIISRKKWRISTSGRGSSPSFLASSPRRSSAITASRASDLAELMRGSRHAKLFDTLEPVERLQAHRLPPA